MAIVERTIALLLLLPAWAAFGAEDDLKETVRKQGEEIRRLRDEVSGLKGQDQLRLERDINAYLETTANEMQPGQQPAYGGRVRLGGYFSLEFRDDGDGKNTEFDQHRLIVKLFSEIANGITFETEIEIEGGGADASFLSDNEVLVEYAELRFEIVEDVFIFKVGAILIPWGRFNKLHDDPLNDLTDRPLVSRRLAAVAFDQPGVGAEGTIEVGSGFFVDFDIAIVQGFDGDISTNGGARDGRQSFRSDNNNNKQVFGRIVISVPVGFLDALEIGTSGTIGKYDDAGNNSVYGWAIDIFVKRGPFSFIAEYMNLRFEQDVGAPISDPRRMDGWYVEFAFHFFPESWRGSHTLFTDESTFTLVIRIEQIDLNHATNGSTFRDDLIQISFGINFRPVERTVIKISYTIVDSDEAGFQQGSADKIVISWATYF